MATQPLIGPDGPGCESHDGHVSDLGSQLWISPTHAPDLGCTFFVLFSARVQSVAKPFGNRVATRNELPPIILLGEPW